MTPGSGSMKQTYDNTKPADQQISITILFYSHMLNVCLFFKSVNKPFALNATNQILQTSNACDNQHERHC